MCSDSLGQRITLEPMPSRGILSTLPVWAPSARLAAASGSGDALCVVCRGSTVE